MNKVRRFLNFGSTYGPEALRRRGINIVNAIFEEFRDAKEETKTSACSSMRKQNTSQYAIHHTYIFSFECPLTELRNERLVDHRHDLIHVR